MTDLYDAHAARLQQLLTQHGGFFPVTVVQQLLTELDLTIDQLLVALLPVVREAAVAPISHFKVGAIVVGATGNLYAGVNQEYYSAPLNQAIHAEQAAIAMAHVCGETDIVKIMASEKPCGHCRQFLNELANASQLEVLLPDGKSLLLTSLLPHAFGPEALGEQGGLLSEAELTLTCADAQSDVELKALHAANKSYSPYAKSYSGLALKTRDGKIYSGSYLENAVFNPSLPALQAAFVHLVQSGAAFADVQEAVLVQVSGAAVDHAAMTVMLLKVMCPQVKLRVLTAG